MVGEVCTGQPALVNWGGGPAVAVVGRPAAGHRRKVRVGRCWLCVRVTNSTPCGITIPTSPSLGSQHTILQTQAQTLGHKQTQLVFKKNSSVFLPVTLCQGEQQNLYCASLCSHLSLLAFGVLLVLYYVGCLYIRKLIGLNFY